MKIGVIGDDFTGSSDAANTLARAGARTLQYAGVPEERGGAGDRRGGDRAQDPLGAGRRGGGAVAGRLPLAHGERRARRSPSSTARPSIRRARATSARWRRRCSASSAATLALVCPAFPATGRTIYQGHLFVHDRLLSESGMEKHPLTPMTDPDLRRWLGYQTRLKVGHLPLAAVRGTRRGRRAGADGCAARRGRRHRRRRPDAARAGGAGASAGDRRLGDPARAAGELRHRAGRGGGLRGRARDRAWWWQAAARRRRCGRWRPMPRGIRRCGSRPRTRWRPRRRWRGRPPSSRRTAAPARW